MGADTMKNAASLGRLGAALAGLSAVSYGAWLAWPPAGYIIGGGLLLAAAILGEWRAARGPAQGSGGA